MYDICIPKNNEKELLERSKQLRYNRLIFLYNYKKLKENQGILIKGKEISRIKKDIFSKASLVIAQSDGSETINKAILSNKNVDLIIDVCSMKGREHTHYRKSTLNQVLAKLAIKNKIGYCINFNRILNEENRIKLIGRIMQNVKIFQKFKVPIYIASFATNTYELRNYHDLVSLANILGVKKLSDLGELIKKKTDPNFIAEGIKIIK